MGTRIDQFREAMESASGEDLRMFMFTRDQLRVLRDALRTYQHRADLDLTARAQVNRWVEAFDPNWKE